MVIEGDETIGRLVVGGLVALLAAIMGGVSGFGSSLVSTPVLLLLGFSLPEVITANLCLVWATRLAVVRRFAPHLAPRRVGWLVLGSLPGVWLGSWVLLVVEPSLIKRAIGLGVLLVVGLLALGRRGGERPLSAGAPVVAGLLGGFCGAVSSLNGVPPALALARARLTPRQFQADMAGYFLMANLLALALLAWRGGLSMSALTVTTPLWLPGSLLGNWLGIRLSTTLSVAAFRRITLLTAGLAGLITLLAA